MHTWTCLLQLLWANAELLFHFKAMSQCSCIISLILLKLQSTWGALAQVLFRITSLKESVNIDPYPWKVAMELMLFTR